ncbi:MAG: arylsulfotransferase family protein, partial [Solirubrobacterales bacterium]
QQVDPEGRVVWRWNSGDHIGLGETPPRWWEKVSINSHRDAAGRDRYDLFHLNSIQPIPGGLLLVSARHTDAVFAISRKTGKVVWKLGGTRTGQSLALTGPDPYRDDPLSGNHDARLTGDVLTVHDNGTRADRPPRLVRYRIDPKAGTATFLSEVEAPADVPYSHCCGSARRFGTGWLVSWGDSRVVAGYDARDELAFRLWLSAPSYRAVPVPRTVPAALFERALEAVEDAPGRPSRAIQPLDRPPFKSEWSYTG